MVCPFEGGIVAHSQKVVGRAAVPSAGAPDVFSPPFPGNPRPAPTNNKVRVRRIIESEGRNVRRWAKAIFLVLVLSLFWTQPARAG
jgi:hypothetical protein